MSQVYIQDMLVRKRLFWIEEAKRLGVRPACLKLGIYRSHYYYWKRRFNQLGIEGLPEDRRGLPDFLKQSLLKESSLSEKRRTEELIPWLSCINNAMEQKSLVPRLSIF